MLQIVNERVISWVPHRVSRHDLVSLFTLDLAMKRVWAPGDWEVSQWSDVYILIGLSHLTITGLWGLGEITAGFNQVFNSLLNVFYTWQWSAGECGLLRIFLSFLLAHRLDSVRKGPVQWLEECPAPLGSWKLLPTSHNARVRSLSERKTPRFFVNSQDVLLYSQSLLTQNFFGIHLLLCCFYLIN